MIKKLLSIEEEDMIDDDLFTYTETVFASVCAWNSSFTLAGLHKHTHGLDYRLAEDCVAQIGRIARETIQEVASSYWHSKRGQESSFASPQPGRLTLVEAWQGDGGGVQDRRALVSSLRLLSLVHGLNFQAGCRVGRLNYDDFYIPEIAEKIDIRNDYLNWMNSRLHPMSRRESPILFCEYPFLFDPQAKTLLLRCDATRQVRTRCRTN
ncbi:hypothetical protein O3P69_013490 [Scylla paramamosain]|uniref:Uncharacterized protein n=1 Tax=Scylla paramamosain TaxID=85552 RepID=A0AAW0SDM4_SCYPA